MNDKWDPRVFRLKDYLRVGTMTFKQLEKALGFAVYDVEPELLSMAKADTELLMQRYRNQGIGRDCMHVKHYAMLKRENASM